MRCVQPEGNAVQAFQGMGIQILQLLELMTEHAFHIGVIKAYVREAQYMRGIGIPQALCYPGRAYYRDIRIGLQMMQGIGRKVPGGKNP